MLTREFRMGLYLGFALGMLSAALDHPTTRPFYLSLFFAGALFFLGWWVLYYWRRES